MITSDLIDRVYEAAVLPDLWPEVLDHIASLGGADKGGVLFAANSNYRGWTASPAMQAIFEDFMASGVAELDPRPKRAIRLNYPGFVSDEMLFTPQEMDEDPFYKWARERGLGWCFGTVVQIPDGDTLIFSWEQSFSRGPFPADLVKSFDPLRPHLARASIISCRLAFERARAATEALTLLRLPAAALDYSNKIVIANALFETLIPHQIQDRRKRLGFADPKTDALFAVALQHLASKKVKQGEPSIASIPVMAAGGLPPAVAHLVPLCRGALDLFAASLCILVLTPVTHAKAPAPQIIQALFDLTPAEADIASGIANGQTKEEIAAERGVSPYTVKSQLRSVFNKTGVSRQSELVSIFAGTALSK